jgi:hypothetical protein
MSHSGRNDVKADERADTCVMSLATHALIELRFSRHVVSPWMESSPSLFNEFSVATLFISLNHPDFATA